MRFDQPNCPGASIKHCAKQKKEQRQQQPATATCPRDAGFLTETEVPDLSGSYGSYYGGTIHPSFDEKSHLSYQR